MRKSLYIICISLTAILLFITGCNKKQLNNNINKKNNITKEKTKTNQNTIGNTTMNIFNKASIAYQNGIYYYCTEKGIFCINEDGTNRKQLVSTYGKYLNVVGDYLYYSNKDGIKKLNISDTDNIDNRTICFDEVYDYLYVVDDYIYYNTYNSETYMFGLYKMNTSGGKNECILKLSDISNINVDGEWIYYFLEQSEDSDTGIYKMKNDGTQKTLILKTDELNGYSNPVMIIKNDWIYLFNDMCLDSYNKPRGIYRMKKNGSQLKCLAKYNDENCEEFVGFCLHEDNLFWGYTGFDKKDNSLHITYKANLDITKKEKLETVILGEYESLTEEQYQRYCDDASYYKYCLNGMFIMEKEADENYYFELYDKNNKLIRKIE